MEPISELCDDGSAHRFSSLQFRELSCRSRCGLVLGELLPDWLLPAPDKRLMTCAFSGHRAFNLLRSRSSAIVIMEVDFIATEHRAINPGPRRS